MSGEKKFNPAALALMSAEMRRPQVGARALTVCLRALAYGRGVSQKEAARRLTADRFPKLRGAGKWEATDLRNAYASVKSVYGLAAVDLLQLVEEADRFENALREARGKCALSFEEWGEITAAPRPPLRIDGTEEGARKLDRLQRARHLLEDGETHPPAVPLSLEAGEDKEARQLRNERLGLILGRRRYHYNRLTQPLEDSDLGNACIEKAAKKLSRKVKGLAALTPEAQGLLGDADTLARRVIYQVLGELGNGRRRPISKVEARLADALMAEPTIAIMKQFNPGLLKAWKWQLEHSEKVPARIRKSKENRTVYLASYVRAHNIDPYAELKIDQAALGKEALEALRSSTDIAEVLGNRLQPTLALLESVKKYDAENENAEPLHLPMIVKPTEWKGLDDGGFRTERRELVKTRSKEQREVLASSPMPTVYRAANALQGTPYKINRRVLEVMEDLKDAPLHVCIANMFKDQYPLYFVWTMDFRGRLYSSIHYPIHPQADDASRGLLEFARGKALGEDGRNWLAVHGANCFGEDKRSLRGRVKWVKEHQEAIIASADKPRVDTFWREAGDPYQFLAFCFEWRDMVKSGNPSAFESHLPVAFDMTCNAFQHIGHLARSNELKEMTNIIEEGMVLDRRTYKLVPFHGQEPGDLYKVVANKLKKMVEKDASSEAVSDKEKADKESALQWQDAISQPGAKIAIDRKLVKKGVMTLPYGATGFTRREHLKKELTQDLKDLSLVYFERKLTDAIRAVAPEADRVMAALKWFAEECRVRELSLKWTVPSGFTAMQEYTDKQGAPDKKKHAASIAANFVHSLDASHLALTIRRCCEKGVTDFATVHDSYATHAADAGTLIQEVWRAFGEPGLRSEAQEPRSAQDEEREALLREAFDRMDEDYGKEHYEEPEPPGADEVLFEPVEEGEVDGPLYVGGTDPGDI